MFRSRVHATEGSDTAPGQRQQLPRNSDWGGHHLAIGVENVDAAVDYLRSVPGVKILGEAQTITEGPIAGDRWVYFLTPWGLQMEIAEEHPIAGATAPDNEPEGTTR